MGAIRYRRLFEFRHDIANTSRHRVVTASQALLHRGDESPYILGRHSHELAILMLVFVTTAYFMAAMPILARRLPRLMR